MLSRISEVRWWAAARAASACRPSVRSRMILRKPGNGTVAQRHHQARAPEAAAVPAQVPALVLGPPGFARLRHLGLRRAALPVLGGEQPAAVHAQGLGLLPAEQVAGTRIPARDQAVE